MTAQGEHTRVESLLRTSEGPTWHKAPAGLHDRVMAALDAAPASLAQPTPSASWRKLSIAAAVALAAGATGLVIGANLWRPAIESPLASSEPAHSVEMASVQAPVESPTVVVSRIFEEFKPAPSSQLVASVSAPMRSEAQGLASETRSAAKTVISRLPFVSME